MIPLNPAWGVVILFPKPQTNMEGDVRVFFFFLLPLPHCFCFFAFCFSVREKNTLLFPKKRKGGSSPTDLICDKRFLDVSLFWHLSLRTVATSLGSYSHAR